jgi:hypothetical protein
VKDVQTRGAERMIDGIEGDLGERRRVADRAVGRVREMILRHEGAVEDHPFAGADVAEEIGIGELQEERACRRQDREKDEAPRKGPRTLSCRQRHARIIGVRAMRRLVFALVASALACAANAPHPVTGTPGGVRYIIGGDSRDDSAHVLPWAFKEAAARGATAFFFLGDMELTPSLDEHFRRALPLLGPVAFYPALGNHEVRFFGGADIGHAQAEAAFKERFLDTPRTPVHSSLPGKVVYSVTLAGGVHWVALDNVSQKGFGKDQLAWLDADLANARQNPAIRSIIVGMHKPLAHNGITTHSMDSDGSEAVGESDAAAQLLEKYNVSLIVASHLHAFIELKTGVIPTYITGGLGAPLDKGGPDYAFHHFLQVDVGDDGLKVTVVRFDGPRSEANGEDKD